MDVGGVGEVVGPVPRPAASVGEVPGGLRPPRPRGPRERESSARLGAARGGGSGPRGALLPSRFAGRVRLRFRPPPPLSHLPPTARRFGVPPFAMMDGFPLGRSRASRARAGLSRGWKAGRVGVVARRGGGGGGGGDGGGGALLPLPRAASGAGRWLGGPWRGARGVVGEDGSVVVVVVVVVAVPTFASGLRLAPPLLLCRGLPRALAFVLCARPPPLSRYLARSGAEV